MTEDDQGYENTTGNDYYEYNNETSGSDDYHRYLATEYSPSSDTVYNVDWSVADLPLAFCFLIYVFNIIVSIHHGATYKKTTLNVRTNFIPRNIDYMIHRYGEWIMWVDNQIAFAPMYNCYEHNPN